MHPQYSVLQSRIEANFKDKAKYHPSNSTESDFSAQFDNDIPGTQTVLESLHAVSDGAFHSE